MSRASGRQEKTQMGKTMMAGGESSGVEDDQVSQRTPSCLPFHDFSNYFNLTMDIHTDEFSLHCPSTGPAASAATASPTHTHTAKAPESLTKKQRQNAAKRDVKKAAKAEAESQRQELLAKHKRELERARTTSGARASVENGHLVWN